MKKSAMTVLSACLMILSDVAAYAAEYFYDHNGSRMRMEVSGPRVMVTYAEPRRGLREVGVRPGTLLFEGSTSGAYVEGMSRIFSANCGEVDYFVYGDFVPGSSFTLRGAAPIVSNISCRIVNNTSDSPHATLVFTALGGSAHPPGMQPVLTPSTRRGCVTGVNSGLNVRVGPGANYGRIHEFPADQCGIQVLNRCRDGWCAVQSGRVMGWVSQRYIVQ